MRYLFLCAVGLLVSSDLAFSAGALCNAQLEQAIRNKTALPPTEITGRVGAIGDERGWLEVTDKCGTVRVDMEVAAVPQRCRIGSHATVTGFAEAGDLQDSIGISGEPWVMAQNDKVSCR